MSERTPKDESDPLSRIEERLEKCEADIKELGLGLRTVVESFQRVAKADSFHVGRSLAIEHAVTILFRTHLSPAMLESAYHQILEPQSTSLLYSSFSDEVLAGAETVRSKLEEHLSALKRDVDLARQKEQEKKDQT